MPVSLRPYQETAFWNVRMAMRQFRKVLLVSPTGSGKCLGRGTPVLMADGRVKAVEEVRAGDLLMGPDSKSRRVISLARGREEMVRVVPRKGEPFVVNRSHIISLKMTGGSKNSCGISDGEIVNLTMDEYRSRSKTFRHCAKLWRTGVEFPPHAEALRLPPYFLGLWLGDGDSKGPSVTTGDEEIRNYLSEYANSVGLEIRTEWNSVGSDVLHLTTCEPRPGRGLRTNPVKLALHQYHILRNKHVPFRYLTASRTERLELLAGIIDADGHLSGNGYEITLKNEDLARQVAFVARSLGFSAYTKSCEKTCCNNGAVGTYWRASINGHVDAIPCKVSRKIASPRRQVKDVLVTGFTLEEIGEAEYFGFEIEGPDRLFLLGDFTVTHNTVIFVHVAERVWAADKRVYIGAHRIEIVEQIAERLRAEGVRFGVVAPGHRESAWSVQVGMIQTMANRLDRLPKPDLFVIDEAHHAVAGRYQTIINHWAGVHILGVTATPQRLDGRGLGDCFDTIVLGPTVQELIADGYLCGFDYYAPPVVADLSRLRVERGDYAIAEMVAALDRPVVTGDAEQNYRRIGKGRPAIAFCSSIAHAEHVAAEFREKGWKAASVDGGMAPAERKRRIAAIGNGELSVLTSCDLISEGTDIPVVAGALLLRKTLSLSLFLQMCGRVLRPKPDGSRAFILDHVSAITAHGLPDAQRKWTLEGKKRRGSLPPPTRSCPKCYLTFSPAKICPGCGYEFPAASNAMLGSILAVPAELQAVTGGWIETGPLNEVLRSAGTWQQIDAIRKARGYHPNWTNIQWDAKNRGKHGYRPTAFRSRSA